MHSGQGNMTLPALGLLFAFIALSSFGQICMKIGLRGEKIPVERSPFRTVANIVAFMMRRWVALGLALYVVSAFVWLMLLSKVRLSVAYPMISLGYGFVVLLSVLILHEQVRWRLAISGLVFIAAGVSCIGFGMGK